MRAYVTKRHGRNGSRLVRQLLSYAYRDMYGAEMPEIAKTADGKPYFENSNIHFSISHTDTHVLCVLGNALVGCDIQTYRDVKPQIAERVCTDSEIENFDFFQLWSLKESWIKLVGRLDRDYKSIEFGGTPDRIIPPPPATAAALYEVEGCSCAICTFAGALPTEIIYVEL